MDLGIRDRACVVTGGSRGIGLEVARQLTTEQAHVLIMGRNEQALRAAAQQLGPRARWLALDVTSTDAGDRATSACLEHFGRLDVLINGASTTAVRSIEQLTDADWQEQWEINVMAPVRLMRAAIPVMTEQGWGRVVNVSSSSGKRPGQRDVAYGVAKAAELALSRAYAEAYAKRGVLINAVTPGPVEGDLWLGPGGLAEQTAAAQHQTKEQVLEAAAQALPIGRLANANEIAHVIVFLCSELASNVTGAAWSVDGGAVPVII